MTKWLTCWVWIKSGQLITNFLGYSCLLRIINSVTRSTRSQLIGSLTKSPIMSVQLSRWKLLRLIMMPRSTCLIQASSRMTTTPLTTDGSRIIRKSLTRVIKSCCVFSILRMSSIKIYFSKLRMRSTYLTWKTTTSSGAFCTLKHWKTATKEVTS